MRLPFLDNSSRKQPSPRPGEPPPHPDESTPQARRHGHSRSTTFTANPVDPTVEGVMVFGVRMAASMDLWLAKSSRPLSDLAQMAAIRDIAQQPAPDSLFELRTVRPNISVCMELADKTGQQGHRVLLQRQAVAVNKVEECILQLGIALNKDTPHGPAMARRLLSWTLAELLEVLADPPMSADLMVLGLREGLSAAELIGLHKVGLTILQVNQVREACRQTGRAEPSLHDIALYHPERELDSGLLAWCLTHGFKAAELPALRTAGWDPGSTTTAPPAPDAVSRQLARLTPTQRSSTDGWTELQHPSGAKTPALYWFKPCPCGSQEEQQLRQGLFVQALAEQLGLSQRILPVRAHVHEHKDQQIYGVLMGPVPALRKSGRPPQSADPDRIRQQHSEVSWLTWLCDMEWREKDRHCTDSREDFQLCLGLPLATSDPDTADDQPAHFIDMGQPQLIPAHLKRTFKALPLDAPPPALEPALAWLSLSDRLTFEGRWRGLNLDETIELPPTPARKIIRLVNAQSKLPPSRTLRQPRTWRQRLARLRVAEDHGLTMAADRLHKLEREHAEATQEPLVKRLIAWGELQRARADLAGLLAAWDPGSLPKSDQPAALRARQRLLDRLHSTPMPARHLSARTLDEALGAGADEDQLSALTSTLKTYEHRLLQPLSADPTALSDLQTLEDWSLRLITLLDKQVRALHEVSDRPVPQELETVRQTLKNDLRLMPEAMAIARELQAAPADRPAVQASAAELIALAGRSDITPAMRQIAWRAGATPADLIRAHHAPPPVGLSPTWALLADSVLQARVAALVEEQTGQPHADPQAVAQMRQRLQTMYPLSEVAAMARVVVGTGDAPPDPPTTPPSRLPLAGSRVMQALGWGLDLSVRDDSPQAQALDRAMADYDQAIRSLESMPLDSAGLSTAAADAAARLADLHTALIAALPVGGLADLGSILLNEAAVLKNLPTVAERLVAARAPADPAHPADTASHLLHLLTPGGPDERRLLHGWLAGWHLADIGQAHADGLPAWVMDLGRSAIAARGRHRQPDVQQRMTELRNQMVLPGGG